MKVFLPPLEIGDNDGFNPQYDIFKRADLGKRLTGLVSAVSQPLVLAIDGQWGSGKSTFLKMWAGELRKQKFPVVVFDAFAHDYAGDAFAPLAAELVALAKEKRKGRTSAANKFISTTVGAAKIVLRSALKVGVKTATLGAIDADEVGKDIAEEASSLTDKYIGELITEQRQRESVLQEFREALSDLPRLLSEASDESTPKPLIFIIDELDRCRPSYALGVLERIKHFFSVPSVHFILGAHLTQLQNSVSMSYGAGIDAGTYLQKFIQLTVHLVDYNENRHERHFLKYISYLRDKLEFDEKDRSDVDWAIELLRHVAEQRNLSFRTIEQIMSVLALAIASTQPNRFAPILAGLCILKITHPDLFARAKRGRVAFGEVSNPLAFDGNPDEMEKAGIEHTAEWWRFCLSDGENEEMARHVRQFGVRDRRRLVPLIANEVVDRFAKL